MAPSAKILSFAQKSPRGSRARTSQSRTRAVKNQGKSGKSFIAEVERVTGIEPALSAWEAEVLPLNYTRAVIA